MPSSSWLKVVAESGERNPSASFFSLECSRHNYAADEEYRHRASWNSIDSLGLSACRLDDNTPTPANSQIWETKLTLGVLLLLSFLRIEPPVPSFIQVGDRSVGYSLASTRVVRHTKL